MFDALSSTYTNIISTITIIGFKEEDIISISKLGMFMFGLSVSIDSLTVGIGLMGITSHFILAPIIFSICSLLFTYLGLILGDVIGNKVGTYSKITGGIILIIIAIMMFVK